MGIEAIGGVLTRSRSRWFGKEKKKRMYIVYVGGEATPRGRPRNTWLEVVKNDMEGLGLVQMLRTVIPGGGRLKGSYADPGLPGAPWDSSQVE